MRAGLASELSPDRARSRWPRCWSGYKPGSARGSGEEESHCWPGRLAPLTDIWMCECIHRISHSRSEKTHRTEGCFRFQCVPAPPSPPLPQLLVYLNGSIRWSADDVKTIMSEGSISYKWWVASQLLEHLPWPQFMDSGKDVMNEQITAARTDVNKHLHHFICIWRAERRNVLLLALFLAPVQVKPWQNPPAPPYTHTCSFTLFLDRGFTICKIKNKFCRMKCTLQLCAWAHGSSGAPTQHMCLHFSSPAGGKNNTQPPPAVQECTMWKKSGTTSLLVAGTAHLQGRFKVIIQLSEGGVLRKCYDWLKPKWILKLHVIFMSRKSLDVWTKLVVFNVCLVTRVKVTKTVFKKCFSIHEMIV